MQIQLNILHFIALKAFVDSLKLPYSMISSVQKISRASISFVLKLHWNKAIYSFSVTFSVEKDDQKVNYI
jgi:hypothetical protein